MLEDSAASADPATATFRNPILDSDWPDLDVTRVGDDYYLVASSFTRTPGLPLLHSRDLVTWRRAGHALDSVPPAEHFALPRPGAGVWAPSIRAHDGLLRIYWADPDHGVWVVTAHRAEGPWSEPHLLLSARGVIDPCPLWDDDGRVWLVFGWARSRSGIDNRLSIVELDADGREILGPMRTLIDGDAIDGCTVLEGPKLYRARGWYWVLAPAGGVTQGWQYAFRSRELGGPWEHRVVLSQGATEINGPHQGAWVTTPSGSDWFVHFQDRGPFGRVAHLQPVTWDADGWPVMGAGGEPVTSAERPEGSVVDRGAPWRSDEFSGDLGRQWHWQATPAADWARTGGGVLRILAIPNDIGPVAALPQVLAQTLPGGGCTFETTLRLVAREQEEPAAGTRAGLALLGGDGAWAGLVQRSGSEVDLVAEDVDGRRALRTIPSGSTVRLRLSSDAEGRCDLDVELGGEIVRAVSSLQAEPGRWVSAEVGLFATAPWGAGAHGAAEFGAVDVHTSGTG